MAGGAAPQVAGDGGLVMAMAGLAIGQPVAPPPTEIDIATYVLSDDDLIKVGRALMQTVRVQA